MTQPTKRFAWHDRDTAAHDMFQLVTYAPPFIRGRALKLLRCFRSSKFFPELEAIVLDETGDIWDRHYALCAIAEMPGDLYLPQFADFADSRHELFNSAVMLAYKHPSNIQWMFDSFDHLTPQIALKDLLQIIKWVKKDSLLNRGVSERMIILVENHPLLLDIEVIFTLYRYGHADVLQQWLITQSKAIVYICLLSPIPITPGVFHLLDSWDDLRHFVFQNCVSLQDEYTMTKEKRAVQHPKRNYQLSELWQETCLIYNSALNGNEGSFLQLKRIVENAWGGTSQRCIATNMIRKLKGIYDVQTPLMNAFGNIFGELELQNASLSPQVRFEVGNALCDISSPEVWEMMIDAFLTLPHNFLEGDIHYWISYITDRLSGSGIDTRSEWPTWKSEEERMLHYTYFDMVTNNPFSEENLREQRRAERFQTSG